jgi:hypothetical protein
MSHGLGPGLANTLVSRGRAPAPREGGAAARVAASDVRSKGGDARDDIAVVTLLATTRH